MTAALNGRGYRAGGDSRRDEPGPARSRHAGISPGQTELLVATDVAARVGYSVGVSCDQLRSARRRWKCTCIGSDGPAAPVAKDGNHDHRAARAESGCCVRLSNIPKARITLAPVPSLGDLLAKRLERTKASIQATLEAGGLEDFRRVVDALAASADRRMLPQRRSSWCTVRMVVIKPTRKFRQCRSERPSVPGLTPRLRIIGSPVGRPRARAARRARTRRTSCRHRAGLCRGRAGGRNPTR